MMARQSKPKNYYANKTFLTGYRILWMMVMFDLPTADKKDRYRYTKFRNFLLDNGFAMAQFSVYYKTIADHKKFERLCKKIKLQVPPYGTVQILSITDKQYESMVTIRNNKPEKNDEKTQLFLF